MCLRILQKPRYYRPKSPPSDEYIKRKYLEILHEIEVIIKIKKNLKEFGDLKNFLERKDEILLHPEDCIEEIKRINNTEHSVLGSNVFDKLLEFCTPDFFSREKQSARGKFSGPTVNGKYRNIATHVTEKFFEENKKVSPKEVKKEMLRLYISIDIDGSYRPNAVGMKFDGKFMGPIQDSGLSGAIKRGISDYGKKVCK